MFINYAHRGASEYAPENTFCSFYLGVIQGANGIETDVQKTKDGILILFHDDTIDRVTNGSGKVSDFTYEELLQFDVIGGKDKKIKDKIVRLEDFLAHFHFMDLHFAIELKQRNIEEETIELLNQYHMSNKTVITSFDFESLRRVKEITDQYAVGYLTNMVNEEVLHSMKEIGGEQICLNANLVTKELVAYIHSRGFSVRAWGVKNTDLMKNAFHSGADGMTVNFPDVLQAYINS